MKTKYEKVESYIVTAVCECDNESQLFSFNEVVLTYPPKYLHKCISCGGVQYLDDVYPKVVHLTKERRYIMAIDSEVNKT